jgi:hypothetical protein
VPLGPALQGRAKGDNTKENYLTGKPPHFRAGSFHHLFDAGAENLILRGLLGCPEENDSKDHIRYRSRSNGYR